MHHHPAGFPFEEVRLWTLVSPPAETHNKAGPSQSVGSPSVPLAQSPLKLDSLFHHAWGNNLIEGQLRAKDTHQPILDASTVNKYGEQINPQWTVSWPRYTNCEYKPSEQIVA